MKQLLERHKLILMEAAVVEQLRRSGNIEFHPQLVNAPLIYSHLGRTALRTLYQTYFDIASNANLPLLICSPTWRADRDRVRESDVKESINVDAVHFMQEIRDTWKCSEKTVKIGAMLGCKNDCYQPEEGLSAVEAEQYHSWQVAQLVEGAPDFLIAETLPCIEEAIGIARAMAETDVPYIISFVISRDGCMLDGTNLADAVGYIDKQTTRQPLGFMVNCAYPSFLCAEKHQPVLFERLIGYQANASSLDHADLDNAEQLEMDCVFDWGNLMLKLNRSYGVKILGGCCGTGPEHLRYIAEHSPENK